MFFWRFGILYVKVIVICWGFWKERIGFEGRFLLLLGFIFFKERRVIFLVF